MEVVETYVNVKQDFLNGGVNKCSKLESIQVVEEDLSVEHRVKFTVNVE